MSEKFAFRFTIVIFGGGSLIAALVVLFNMFKWGVLFGISG